MAYKSYFLLHKDSQKSLSKIIIKNHYQKKSHQKTPHHILMKGIKFSAATYSPTIAVPYFDKAQ